MLAGLLLFIADFPARAGEKAGHGSGQDVKKGKEPEHKLTADEEVGDRRGWVIKNKVKQADGSWEREWEEQPWSLFHELHIDLPLVGWFQIGDYAFPTKYMWLMLIAALLTFFIYRGLARRVQQGEIPRGPFWNFFESLLTFIRNEVAKPNFPEHAHHEPGHAEPAAGHHEAHHDEPALPQHPADQFVPLLWTLFVYILFCNLLGLIPFLGSPTANIYMTAGLALCVFIVMHGAAVVRLGGWHYLKALWPKIDLPAFYGIGWLFKNVISLMIFVIELISSVIKSGVLAIRLFANMFAGHMVLASILLFIVATRESALWAVVTVFSVLGVIALSLLELFVAFLQAYIFTFLTALFIGMAVNPEH